MLAFLTVGLTNCGRNAPKNDIAQEFEEPFQTDDISAIPLEEKDLEDLAKQEASYFLMELPFFLASKPEDKYFGKLKHKYVYNKNNKTFESHLETESKQSDIIKSLKMIGTYSIVAPYDLLKAEAEFTVTNEKTKAKVHDENYEFSCQNNSCTFTSKENSKSISISIPKTALNPINLKAELLPQLIARHKFDMDRVRLSFQIPSPTGISSAKLIFFFTDPKGDGDLNFTKIIKRYHPNDEEKYSLGKNEYAVDRNGKILSFTKEMIKHIRVDLGTYDSAQLNAIKDELTYTAVPPSGKDFSFAHAIVKGEGRYMLRNTRMQKVSHFPHHSEVELLKDNSGTADSTAPTATETTNKKEHYVEPEWQKEILSLIKDLSNTNEKVFNILTFITHQIRGTQTNGTLSFREIFDLKRGDCSEFTKSFVLLARENGIAARKHKGYALPKHLQLKADGTFKDLGSAHAWANYYSPEDGEWVYADAALRAMKKSPNYYILDFGVDSPDDIEQEDYKERPLLHVRFVFDQITRDKAVRELSQ